MTTAEPRKLTLPKGTPEGYLLACLEPWLWVDQITPVQTWGYRPPYHEHWLTVRGIVKPQGEWPAELPAFEDQDHVWTWANGVRAHLFGVAQTAIIAAEEAGYAHDRHPEIEIGGDIFHDRERHLDIPRAQCTVRMWLREAAL